MGHQRLDKAQAPSESFSATNLYANSRDTTLVPRSLTFGPQHRVRDDHPAALLLLPDCHSSLGL